MMPEEKRFPITAKILDPDNGPLADGLALAKDAAFLNDAKGFAAATQALIALAKLELVASKAIESNDDDADESDTDAGNGAGDSDPSDVGPARVLAIARAIRGA
jgi:hypothetical protein